MRQPHSEQAGARVAASLGEVRGEQRPPSPAKTSPGQAGALPSVLFFSVGDDVHQVLIVQVAGHVGGEGGEHLVNLQ